MLPPLDTLPTVTGNKEAGPDELAGAEAETLAGPEDVSGAADCEALDPGLALNDPEEEASCETLEPDEALTLDDPEEADSDTLDTDDELMLAETDPDAEPLALAEERETLDGALLEELPEAAGDRDVKTPSTAIAAPVADAGSEKT